MLDCDGDVLAQLLKLALYAPSHAQCDYSNGEASTTVLQIIVQLVKVSTPALLSSGFIHVSRFHLLMACAVGVIDRTI